jgi:hypothetical protein
MAATKSSVPTVVRVRERDRQVRVHAHPTRRPSSKLLVFALVMVGLVGAIVFTGLQEASQTGSAAVVPGDAGASAAGPARKSLSRAEEAYAQTLLPIHNEVKLATLKLVSGNIQYKLGNVSKDVLKGRADEAEAAYAHAEGMLSELQAPPSMQSVHEKYLRAVRLYRQARDELALTFVDGREEHMLAALEPRLQSDQILREVGRELWPNEYVPN